MKPWAEAFYKSSAWKQVREAYIIYKHGICERCGSPGVIVHHKIYLTPENINDPNVTLNFDNLELLCKDCHNKEHSKSPVIKSGLRFDENGDLIQSDTPRDQNFSGTLGDRRAEFQKPGHGYTRDRGVKGRVGSGRKE